MKVMTSIAVAAAVVLAGAAASTTVALGQEREPLIRAFDMMAGSGRIGVTVRDVESDDKLARDGVIVTDLDTGGPADKAGIKRGDTLTEFDGERVRSTRQFTRLVQETPSGRSVQATLLRDGKKQTVNVTPEHSAFDGDFSMRLLDGPMARMLPSPPPPPDAPSAPRAPRPPTLAPYDFAMPRLSGRRLGITVESLDSQLAEYFGVKDGLLVKSVAEESSAQKAGVKAGDVITSFNGSHVYDTSDLNRAVERMDSNGEFTLEVVRDRKTQALKGKLEARDRRARTGVRTTI
jgi:serine protease Do